MTTKSLDNEICTFRILLSWGFPRKTAFLDKFPLCPQGPPLLKSENFVFIVVSPPLSLEPAEKGQINPRPWGGRGGVQRAWTQDASCVFASSLSRKYRCIFNLYGLHLMPVILRPIIRIFCVAAQCEIPPHIAQYPFEIVSQRGVSHPFALFS